jgi:hypothetical protein
MTFVSHFWSDAVDAVQRKEGICAYTLKFGENLFAYTVLVKFRLYSSNHVVDDGAINRGLKGDTSSSHAQWQLDGVGRSPRFYWTFRSIYE